MKFELLLHQLRDRLNEIKNQNPDIIKQANLSITICRSILSSMNKKISTSSFDNEADEINFFKSIKVQPLSQLIYYSELRSFEIQYPKASFGEQKEYLEKKIRKTNKFFNYNIEFIQYVRQEKTNLDTSYYTRANYNSFNITDTKSYYRAPEFSTSHDILLGKVIGFDLFINYLKNRLYYFQNPKAISLHDMHKKSKLKWLASKTDLVELAYGLQSSGAIDADIIEIIAVLEAYLNIKIGDPYRTILGVRSRKISQTKFMDKMKKALLRRFEELDQ